MLRTSVRILELRGRVRQECTELRETDIRGHKGVLFHLAGMNLQNLQPTIFIWKIYFYMHLQPSWPLNKSYIRSLGKCLVNRQAIEKTITDAS
jgi:hypothetical protein